jgi:GTPase SAR1 family protein
LAKERKLLLRERTIILLGTGSSGKSTVFKQMKLQHGSSFGFEERQDYKSYIHQFILCNVKKIISLVSSLKYSYDDQETLIIAKKIMAINVLDGQVLDQETALGIQKLLKSASVELIMKRSFERNLDESFGYFYKSPGSFLTESYLPSDQDILMCRHKTNYIVKSAFTTKDHIFNVIDVAGQRDKRSRWSQYCEKGVEAVVVLVSAVSFNQYMDEDPKVPCMKDSINMLTEILKNASLKNSAIIILINKIDLLEERLRHYNVSDYFRNYSQKNTPKKYLQFLKRYFYSICKEHGKSCYVYETTATDQLLMRKIIDSIL